jgi:ubiquitin-protein ligase
MYSQNLSLKRINKDIKEIIKSPLEGIGITSLDNNPYEYIVNIQLMTGIYQGFCLQLLLTISDNYPISPPKILIYPGQSFDKQFLSSSYL